MIAALPGGLSTSPLERAALRHGATGLAIVLFQLSIMRVGERIGQLSERHEATKKTDGGQI